MRKKSKAWVYIISVLIAYAVALLSLLFTKDSMQQYSLLDKPPLAPDSIVFPIVWGILYTLMGISSAIIYLSHSRQKKPALTVYAVQLVLTFVWTLLFFKLKLRLASLVLLVVMVILVISMIVRFGRIKPIAGYMNIPYLLWLLFATYLNVGTYILNG